MIKIIGFFKRERDNTEYILYEENGKKKLTNGICTWTEIIEKVMPQIVKIDSIDNEKLLEKLKSNKRHSDLIEALEKLEKGCTENERFNEYGTGKICRLP